MQQPLVGFALASLTMGPWGITYLNPADDPQNGKK